MFETSPETLKNQLTQSLAKMGLTVNLEETAPNVVEFKISAALDPEKLSKHRAQEVDDRRHGREQIPPAAGLEYKYTQKLLTEESLAQLKKIEQAVNSMVNDEHSTPRLTRDSLVKISASELPDEGAQPPYFTFTVDLGKMSEVNAGTYFTNQAPKKDIKPFVSVDDKRAVRELLVAVVGRVPNVGQSRDLLFTSADKGKMDEAATRLAQILLAAGIFDKDGFKIHIVQNTNILPLKAGAKTPEEMRVKFANNYSAELEMLAKPNLTTPSYGAIHSVMDKVVEINNFFQESGTKPLSEEAAKLLDASSKISKETAFYNIDYDFSGRRRSAAK